MKTGPASAAREPRRAWIVSRRNLWNQPINERRPLAEKPSVVQGRKIPVLRVVIGRSGALLRPGQRDIVVQQEALGSVHTSGGVRDLPRVLSPQI